MNTKIYEKAKNFIKTEWKTILFLILFALFTNLRLPYIIEAPGNTVDLSGRIEVENAYSQEGSLNMSSVKIINATPMTMLFAGIRSDWDISKKSDFTVGNESFDETVERQKLFLKEGYANATFAAFNEVGKSVSITSENEKIVYISDKANTDLKIGDTLLEINNETVSSSILVKEMIKDAHENDKIDIKVSRNGKDYMAYAIIYMEDDTPKIGIMSVVSYEYETDPKVDISYKNTESGPSGGFMTSLQIYNYLTEDDITKGRKIIGTGTISKNGEVGEIDGVKYKLSGAVKSKADIFICPKGNYEEALEVKEKYDYKIDVIGVDSLSEAILYLKG